MEQEGSRSYDSSVQAAQVPVAPHRICKNVEGLKPIFRKITRLSSLELFNYGSSLGCSTVQSTVSSLQGSAKAARVRRRWATCLSTFLTNVLESISDTLAGAVPAF
jgi:hypothetical protein